MVYITVKQSPVYHQITLEELLFHTYTGNPVINENTTNTKTYESDYPSERFTRFLDTSKLVEILVRYNESTDPLREKDRHSLYRTFYIPKKSGGLRKINAPEPELMDALRRLKTIFEEEFHALYHTTAFAYVRGRSTLDAIKRHQANESKWFCKLDLHDFFGSTTLDFVMQQFSAIYPFSEVCKYPIGRSELRKALELAFLDGGLPQGTPISPLITNVMMIPVDFKLSNKLRDFEQNRFVYTRYADDFTISSRYDFSQDAVSRLIMDTLAEFHAPFTLNDAKTRYGSSSGRNWNLGLMLNKDNEITVGYKKKRQFQSMLHNYITDKLNGVQWSQEDIRHMKGLRDYYRMVEQHTIDAIIAHINSKMGVDVLEMIREDLR